MSAGVLVKLVEAGACVPGSKLVTWPWSVAFAAAKAANWDSNLIMGSVAAAMLVACCLLVLTMVDMKAVNYMEESQRFWWRADSSLEDSQQRLCLRVYGSLEECQTAALEVVGSLEERTTATWVRGVVNSLEESDSGSFQQTRWKRIP